MKEKFEDILDQALEHLGSGEELEAFLSQHPEWRRDLLPLLAAARVVSETPAASFSSESKERIRESLLSAPKTKAQRLRWLFVPGWARRVALAFVSLLLLGTGVAVAVGRSLPTSPLYPLKRAAERVRLSLAASDEAKAYLHLTYAERRLKESEAVTGRPGALHRAIGEMARETVAAVEAASPVAQEKREDLMAELLALTERQERVLRGVAFSSPQKDREAILRAVDDSRRGYERAMEALAGTKLEKKPKGSPQRFEHKPAPRPALTAPAETLEGEEQSTPATEGDSHRGGEVPSRGEGNRR